MQVSLPRADDQYRCAAPACSGARPAYKISVAPTLLVSCRWRDEATAAEVGVGAGIGLW